MANHIFPRRTIRLGAALAAAAGVALAQYPPPQYPPQGHPEAQSYPQQYPPPMAPQQLDQLVQRIALYPDPLLAQILTASTFYNQIPDAANWANQHSSLTGQALADAINEDQLPWDPSVLALLPFPSVLNMMASDMGWTQQLGNAVLTERPAVMDAVQRQRQIASNYGYLQSNQYVQVINQPGAIQIVPVNPSYIYVPSYDPYIVFARPRPGFFVGGAIRFGPGITIGAFAPFGWRSPAFEWREHSIVIDHHPWVRTWDNRVHYEHHYEAPVPHWQGREGRWQEHHDVRGRGHEERHDRH
jgi:hypothetical protein